MVHVYTPNYAVPIEIHHGTGFCEFSLPIQCTCTVLTCDVGMSKLIELIGLARGTSWDPLGRPCTPLGTKGMGLTAWKGGVP